MGETTLNDELANRSQPIAEDMRFQRISWRVQQVGWVVLALAILAALLGAFSNGWLSWTSSETGDGTLRVDYQLVYRNGLESWIDLTIAGATGQAERKVVLSPPLLERIGLVSTQPDALRAAAHPDGLHLTFAIGESGASRVRLNLLPHDAGGVEGTIRLDAGEPLPIEFLILP